MPLEELERLAWEGGPEAVRNRVVPPARALDLPEALLSAPEANDLAHGRSVLAGPHAEGARVRAVDATGRLVAVCVVSAGRIRPVRVFVTPAEL